MLGFKARIVKNNGSMVSRISNIHIKIIVVGLVQELKDVFIPYEMVHCGFIVIEPGT